MDKLKEMIKEKNVLKDESFKKYRNQILYLLRVNKYIMIISLKKTKRTAKLYMDWYQ